ncbi:hypothetical protein CLV46_1373 [Diaminobutyricimonas aerilata]|uniref:Neutral zinc metallopeptidase n=1 Tax=Diaminobutyricimonas aerilata TaxID=1162967 RepID=A0A2M9CIW4_9MICO|nr:neutral zinc metallopeptidase [Diaminobutyricimonas aerilata]PJJ71820.1 hypothetical protein CLV46_1373 [Diaminobutyricimonas aerilata]
MTFNDDARIGRSRTSKRGRNAGIAVGGGGLGVIAILLVGQLLGVDLSGLVGGAPVGGSGGGTDTSLEQCDTGRDANELVECRMVGAADSLDAFWSEQLGQQYVQPQLILFEQATNTGCGSATSAVGPFYCPPDQSVYIDTSFYAELSGRFGASGGSLAQLYVVAHEWGHHISNITGAMDGLDRSETGPASDGVRLELQADCFAGAWVAGAENTLDENSTPLLKPPTPAEIADALSAASAVGDDRIQEATTGQVQPETWTHGSSEMRQRWFTIGREQGRTACDTFSVPGDDL